MCPVPVPGRPRPKAAWWLLSSMACGLLAPCNRCEWHHNHGEKSRMDLSGMAVAALLRRMGGEPGLHLGDLGFLRGDDIFGQLADFGILAIGEFHLGHVDRAPM